MLASVKRASAQLEAFLTATHSGDALDRPVLDYLAGAIADAADEASCEADVTASAAAVAEMVAEYLVPPRSGDAITERAERMIQAVRAGQDATPSATTLPPLQQEEDRRSDTAPPASALASLSLNASAAEWKPSAAAPPFTPSAAAPLASDPAPESDGGAEGGDARYYCDGDTGGEWEYEVEDGYAYEGYGQDEDWAYVNEDQALEALVMQFPHYAPDVLREILANNDGSLPMTLAILTQFEQEIAAQQEAHSAAETPAEPDAPPPKIDDEELFPSLGGATAGPSSGSSEAAFSWRKADDFAGALRRKAAAAEPQQDAYAQAGSRSRAPPPGWCQPQSARREARAFEWVDTGESVASQYRDARAEARDYARIRNTCFEQATKAFLAGNKALAKELGLKGRAAAESMRAAHDAASQQIYQSRNQRGGAKDMIDLHGLHAREGVRFLQSEIEAFRGRGESRVYVLVGTGHHTRTNKSTLPAAVEDYLKANRIPFTVAQPGLLQLQLLR